MVLALLLRRQPNMTSALPGDFVTESSQFFRQLGTRYIARQLHSTRSGGVNYRSSRNYLFMHEMKTDYLWRFAIIEVTAHCLANLFVQSLSRVRFRED
jgi:hypothetical protein